MSLVTIKESSNTADLLILKSKLESEGIRCYIKDEYTSQVLNFLTVMSAKLQVSEEDLKTVEKIMKESEE